MRIHLDRKKLLCLSFFLCCVLPPCFNWFSLEPEADAWTGLSLMPVPLLVGMTLYAFALLFDRFRHVLSLGVLAHGLLLAACLTCVFSFPRLSGTAGARDLHLSLEATEPGYWISLALLLVHLILFTTTEVAVQRLSQQNSKA